MDETYEHIFSENYNDLYQKIKEIVPLTPDQRFFQSPNWVKPLTVWDTEKIWQTLLEELEILLHADKRGDIIDMKIYTIINNTMVKDIHKLFYPTVTAQLSYSDLKNFIATYPTLSYILINCNKTYQLAVAGNHLILIDEIANWPRKKISDLNIWRCKFWRERNYSYAAAWIHYCNNEFSIKKLLDYCDISKEYEFIAASAAFHKNILLLNLLYWRLTRDQKFLIAHYIVKFDIIDAWKDVISIENSLIPESFITAIWWTAEKVFLYIIANYNINFSLNEDILKRQYVDLGNGQTTSLTEFMHSKNLDYDVATNAINITYQKVHEALYESSNISPLISSLVKLTAISRFNAFNQQDLLYSRIRQKDWSGLKMLIELGMDIETNLVHEFGNARMPLLIYVLNKEAIPDDIKEFVIGRYDVDRLALLCAVAKKRPRSAKYLIRSSAFTNRELCTVLRYGCTEINTIIMIKIGLKYIDIEPRDTFVVKN